MRRGKIAILLSLAASLFINICTVSAQSGTLSDGISTYSDDVFYSYDFNDGVLPAEFDTSAFTVENGQLKTTTAGSSFTLPDVSKNCSFEFKMKLADSTTLPKFNVNFGNTSVTYDNLYRQNNTWDDKLSIYNRITWATVKTVWANGNGVPADTFFATDKNEYSLKYIAYENMHSLYIDNALIFAEECSGDMASYNVSFSINNAASGVYLDDIKVKRKTDASVEDPEDEPTEEPVPDKNTYIYTFNDGNIPEEFNSSGFSIENDKLRVDGATGSFTLTNVPKDCSIEFKIEPTKDGVIPHLNLLLRTCNFSYTANYVQNKTWDDSIRMYDTEKNNEEFAVAWAGDSFLPEKAGGHVAEFIAYGDVYSLYIDNVLIISEERPVTEEKESYDLTFSHKNGNGTIPNTGFYLDDIVVKGVYEAHDTVRPSLPSLSADGATEMYFQSFDSLTALPSAENGVDYRANTIENGSLCVTEGEGFVIPSVYSNHVLEMDIQSKDREALEIKIDLKKDQDGYGFEVVYKDTDTSTPGSKWTFIKKDFDGKEILSEVERSVDDITSSQLSHLSIESFNDRLAVYIEDELVAEAVASMLKGADYSAWVSTEFYPSKLSEDEAEAAVIVNNIGLTAYPMDISDAISCSRQVFINNDETITSISQVNPGKVKIKANAVSIDSDMSRDVTAIMVMFKDGYMINASAKTVTLPKMRLLTANNIPIELEMDISENDLAGEDIKIEFYVWDNLKNMASCRGLSELN